MKLMTVHVCVALLLPPGSTGSFPPYKGVVPIICSWFFSPILTAAAAAIIFFITRTLVLRKANSFKLAFWVLPPFAFIASCE